jgi:hypothetical protein
VVYNELRRLAHQPLRREAEGHSLNTTALVHEENAEILVALDEALDRVAALEPPPEGPR